MASAATLPPSHPVTLASPSWVEWLRHEALEHIGLKREAPVTLLAHGLTYAQADSRIPEYC